MNADATPSALSISHIARIHRASISYAAGLADLISTPACQGSLAKQDAVCASCWTDISFIRAPLCNRLRLPAQFDTGGTIISAVAAALPPNYGRARAVAHFDGVMREMILQFKCDITLNARKLFGY